MSEVYATLEELFGFTSEDIQANRRFRVSWRQRRQLWGRFWGVLLGMTVLVVVPLLVIWFLISWTADLSFSDVLADNRATVGYVVIFLLAGLYALVNLRSLLLFFDLLIGRVRAVRGIAHIWGRYLEIGKYRFVIVEDEAFELLQEGMAYRVFMLPASKTLLSIEFAE